jgi:hypothetical protein
MLLFLAGGMSSSVALGVGTSAVPHRLSARAAGAYSPVTPQ